MSDARAHGWRRNLVWFLVLLIVLLVWLFWKPPAKDDGVAATRDAWAEMDPDDILVDLRDDVGDATVADIERELGIDLVLVSRQSLDERFYRAHVDPARRDALLDALGRRSDVETAEPDAEYSLIGDPQPDAGFPNDPQYKHQWHLRQIGMPDAWKLASGKGVVVAVIDTGVAYEDHGRFRRVPDLARDRMVAGYNFVADDAHANDDHGHGTHVAGTIAQSTNNRIGVAGVAYGAKIMPLKVLSASGSGSVAAIADAIHFAADNGAKVINMSLGGRFPSKVLERAVKYAHDKGVVVVCAAGNDGRGKVSFPAAYPGAVGVAATQYDEATTFYSNWGKGIDVAAPGGNTRVDQDGDGRPDGVLQNTIVPGDPSRDDYLAFMGTSMASPHVAGVAALVVAQGVTDPDAVEKVLEATARAPRGRGLDQERYGAGIIDAPAAVKKSRSGLGGWQLALGLLLAGAAASHARARGRTGRLGPSLIAGVALGASGLFFLPYLGGVFAEASTWPVIYTLTHGFPSWDLSLLGPTGHGHALFFSALAPVLLVSAGYGVRRLRVLLAGFSAGVAGHLLVQMAADTADIRWVPGTGGLDAAWLLVNAVLCVSLAYLVLRD